MRLTADNGNSIEIRVEGYEFPDVTPQGADDYDANWLRIHGRVVNGSDAWEFRDPCLTTWEAHALISWFREASEGNGAAAIDFIEPGLSFQVIDADARSRALTLVLTRETAQPGNISSEISLLLPAASLARAADELASELKDYPVR